MNKAVVLFGVVLILAYITMEVSSLRICPYCTCAIENSPVCGKQEVTGRLRGFTSRCLLDCSNLCRKNKYTFYKSGRCGKPLKKMTATTTTTTTKPVQTNPTVIADP